jgi:outer membrane biogenesis lipoprotein LolB
MFIRRVNKHVNKFCGMPVYPENGNHALIYLVAGVISDKQQASSRKRWAGKDAQKKMLDLLNKMGHSQKPLFTSESGEHAYQELNKSFRDEKTNA